MIDPYDASHDRLRLAVARGLSHYDEAQLFDCLSDPEPVLRTAAARQLHVRGSRAAYERSVTLLDHPRYEQREIGAFVLGQFGTPDCPYASETFGYIPRLFEDIYVEVRAAAAQAAGSLAMLGHQPPPAIVHQLVEQSRSLEPRLRAEVAFALGMMRDPAALPCLQAMTDDADPDVRDAVEAAIEWHEERADDEVGIVTDESPIVASAEFPSASQRAIRSANG